MNSLNTFYTFCSDTSLHGWAYLQQPRSSKLDKLIWTLVILGSQVTAAYLGAKVLSEFHAATVVMKLENSTIDVQSAIFPKILIQNPYKMRYCRKDPPQLHKYKIII